MNLASRFDAEANSKLSVERYTTFRERKNRGAVSDANDCGPAMRVGDAATYRRSDLVPLCHRLATSSPLFSSSFSSFSSFSRFFNFVRGCTGELADFYAETIPAV